MNSDSATRSGLADQLTRLNQGGCAWYHEDGEALADCEQCGETMRKEVSSVEPSDEMLELKHHGSSDGTMDEPDICDLHGGYFCSTECLVEWLSEFNSKADGGLE